MDKIKNELRENLGNDVGVITDVLPELTVYLGELPKPATLNPSDSSRRLFAAFTTLLRTITTHKSLILFLDDLQWADLTTLDLIEHLAKAPFPKFMLVGAYRSGDVEKGDPLNLAIKNLTRTIRVFKLQPLKEAAVHELLSDTLGQSSSLDVVAQKLIQKSSGNPFFVHQILKKLYADQLLTRCPEQRAWIVDLHKLDQLQVSQNVVEFLLTKFRDLDPQTQDFLNAGAAFGTTFDFHSIAQALKIDPDKLIPAVEKAVNQEIIRPVRGSYQHLISSRHFNSKYRIEFQFLHDRLQQVSYELKSEETRKQIHFDLGELLTSVPIENQDSVAIAEHYLRSDFLRTKGRTKLKIGDCLIRAAIHVSKSSAFKKAFQYISQARSLFEDEYWQSHPDLMRNLFLELSKISLRAGEKKESRESCQILLERSRNDLEKAEAYGLMADQANLEYNFHKSVELSLEGLKALHLHFEVDTTDDDVKKTAVTTLEMLNQIQKQGKRLLPILELPDNKDPRAMLILTGLARLQSSSYLAAKSNLTKICAMTATQLTLKYGLTDFASASFATTAIAFNTLGQYGIVRDLEEVGLSLIDSLKSRNQAQSVYAYFLHLTFCCFLNMDGAELEHHCSKVFELAIEAKEFIALMAASYHVEVKAQHGSLGKAMEALDNRNRIMTLGFQAAITLFDSRSGLFELLYTASDEDAAKVISRLESTKEATIKANHEFGESLLRLQNGIYNYLFSSPDLALVELLQCFKTKSMLAGSMSELKLEFYYALALIATQHKNKLPLSDECKNRLEEIREKFRTLSSFFPANFDHYSHFLEAEYSFYLGKPMEEVTRVFRRALESAKRDGNYYFEALINEKIGDYFLAYDNPEVAALYIRTAHKVYTAWEAWARVRYLEARYRNFFPEIGNSNCQTGAFATPSNTTMSTQTHTIDGTRNTGTISTEQNLDFYGVLKAARSLSSEVVLTQLTDKLLKIVLEVSGAEKGGLLLPDSKGNFTLHSRAYIEETPFSLIDRVRIKKAPLIVVDASKEERFKTDSYFKKNEVHSLVCLPSLNQGNLLAILYLENNAVAGAFTEARLTALDILVSQAAVSIQNARIYETLERKVKERTSQLASKTRDVQAMLSNLQQGIFAIQKDFKIHPEYSSYLEIILDEKELAGKESLPLLLNHPSISMNTRGQIEGVLFLLFGESELNFELNSHLLPKQIVRKAHLNDQNLELDWKPIIDEDGKIEKILVSVRDVTEIRRLQIQAKDQKLELEMIGQILDCGVGSFLRNYDEFTCYINENRNIIQELDPDQPLPEDKVNHLFRNIHTIKGNVRILGLSYTVDTLHEAEELLVDLKKGKKTNVDLKRLGSDLDSVQSVLEKYHRLATTQLGAAAGVKSNPVDTAKGRASARILKILESQRLSSLTRDDKVRIWDQMYAALDFAPIQEILHEVLNSIPELANSLGKPSPEIMIEDQMKDSSRFLFALERERVLKAVFTHCLRNTVDHGLETLIERKEKGKKEGGIIRLSIKDSRDGPTPITISLSDNGRGLNLVALKAEGIKRGTCTETALDHQVAELIFETGISTSEKVTQISGRGVGMNAVRTWIEEGGGRVEVEFTSERTSAGFRPFQLILRLPQNWVYYLSH